MLLSQFSKISRNISKAFLVPPRIGCLIRDFSSTKNVVDQSTIDIIIFLEISPSANISSFIHSIILFEAAYDHVLQNRISIYEKQKNRKKVVFIAEKLDYRDNKRGNQKSQLKKFNFLLSFSSPIFKFHFQVIFRILFLSAFFSDELDRKSTRLNSSHRR